MLSDPPAKQLSFSMLRRLLLALSLLVSAHAGQAPAEEGPQIDRQWGVEIPLRDGVRLHATMYRPRGQPEALPCVFVLTPYVAQAYHERAMYFAAQGYVFLAVDVRGRGNSEGEFAPLIQEANDGHDVVEWLARQPWCNGKVAMWGGSYSGYDQWAAASTNPPHLTTIVPVASPFEDPDVEVHNIWPVGLMPWFMWVSGRTLQMQTYLDRRFWIERYREHYVNHRPFAELDRSIGQPSAIFREWVTGHPHSDEYWDAYNPSAAEYAAMDLPILIIMGQYDPTQLGDLEHYERLMRNAAAAARDNKFLLIGPWNHSQTRTPTAEVGGLKLGAASVLDMNDLHRQWYDWTMKSGPRPALLKKPVTYYVTGAEIWRHADSLQALTRHMQPLYLASDAGRANDVFVSGRLQPQAPDDAAADSYVYDPLDVSMADLQASLDPANLREQREVLLSDGNALIYHSAPFAEDTELAGFFRLDAWIALDQPDTDFSAAVYEIAPDGSSLLLAKTLKRARYRQSARAPQLVPRGKVLKYRFERFPFVARRIAWGSRLRLVFGPVNSIYSEKNYNSGGIVAQESARDARTVTVRLFHDAKRRSVLHVPIAATDD